MMPAQPFAQTTLTHDGLPPALRHAITSSGAGLELGRVDAGAIEMFVRTPDTRSVRLSVVIDAAREREIDIRVDGASVARWVVTGCRALTIDLPPGLGAGTSIEITLDADELTSIVSVHMAALDPDEPLHREAPAPLPPLDGLDDMAVMRAFESLGDNCELGIAQRRFGAEPLDLYRFSAVPMGWILHGIDCGFAKIDAVADNQITLEHRPDGQHYYYVWQSRYRIQYETGIRQDLKTLDAMTRESVRRMHYLAWRLMQSVREGQRIMTYRSERRLDAAEVLAFSDRLARRGPAFGMIVQQREPGPAHAGAPDDAPNGAPNGAADFEWVAPNVLRATMTRFADAACVVEAIDADAWRDLCRTAYGLVAARRMEGIATHAGA